MQRERGDGAHDGEGEHDLNEDVPSDAMELVMMVASNSPSKNHPSAGRTRFTLRSHSGKINEKWI